MTLDKKEQANYNDIQTAIELEELSITTLLDKVRELAEHKDHSVMLVHVDDDGNGRTIVFMNNEDRITICMKELESSMRQLLLTFTPKEVDIIIDNLAETLKKEIANG